AEDEVGELEEIRRVFRDEAHRHEAQVVEGIGRGPRTFVGDHRVESTNRRLIRRSEPTVAARRQNGDEKNEQKPASGCHSKSRLPKSAGSATSRSGGSS